MRSTRLPDVASVQSAIGRWMGLLPALVAVSTALRAEDWPKWRGPRGDGTWDVSGLPDRLPAGGLDVRWRVPIGGGYAGIVVEKGRVFTMDRPKPTRKAAPGEKLEGPDGTERVLCLDAGTGRLLWAHEYPATYNDLDYGNGPRAAPTLDGGQVFALGAVGMLTCLDAATGELLWARDTVPELKARIPTWGFAASPLVDGEQVIVHVGAEPDGSLVALDRQSGREVWRSLPDPAGYATPILVATPAGRQLVAWTPENVRSVDPSTGRLLWSVPYVVTYGVAIAAPLYADSLVFVSGYWEGSKAIRLGATPESAELAWEENRNLRGLMAAPLYRDGLVYLLDKQYGLTCFELATGKKLWDDGNRLTPRGRNPQATLVWIGASDRVVALNSEGELVLARLSRDGYREEDRAKLLGPTWSYPAYANQSIFARDDHELCAARLARD